MLTTTFIILLVIILLVIIVYLIYKSIICEDPKILKDYFNMKKELWSKGPIRSNYSKRETELISSYKFLIKYMKESSEILWIRNGSHSQSLKTDLDIVADNLHFLNTPLILVTTDGDRSVPSSYKTSTVRTLLESPKIRLWFTQNYDGSIKHQKLKPIPIGFDLHTKKWLIGNSVDNKISFIASQRSKHKNRKVLCDAHLSISHPERSEMIKIIKDNKDIVFIEKTKSFVDLMELYGTHEFIISPRGNGIDCHRTWEAILAGCIVITRTSPLDEMFISNKLPVVIIQEWNELNDDLPQKLEKWSHKYSHLTYSDIVLPKLLFDYWLGDKDQSSL